MDDLDGSFATLDLFAYVRRHSTSHNQNPFSATHGA